MLRQKQVFAGGEGHSGASGGRSDDGQRFIAVLIQKRAILYVRVHKVKTVWRGKAAALDLFDRPAGEDPLNIIGLGHLKRFNRGAIPGGGQLNMGRIKGGNRGD